MATVFYIAIAEYVPLGRFSTSNRDTKREKKSREPSVCKTEFSVDYAGICVLARMSD
jgi:hypothetical protein